MLHRILSIIIVLLVLPVSIGYAEVKTEYKYAEGTCEAPANVDSWYSVTTYENGKPVRIKGRDCNGAYYDLLIATVTQPTDPTGGATPVHTGTTELGTWGSVITWNAGVPTPIGGYLPTNAQPPDNGYWVFTGFQNP